MFARNRCNPLQQSKLTANSCSRVFSICWKGSGFREGLCSITPSGPGGVSLDVSGYRRGLTAWGGGGSAESTGLLIILKIEGNFTLLLVPIKQEKEMMPIFRTTLLY